jgi:Arm DNA-binding domain
LPRRAKGLTAQGVLRERKPGRYGDGGGLYLLVRAADKKFWIFRYTRAGRTREMGLGAAIGPGTVRLAAARKKAGALRDIASEGRDPIAERAAAEARAKAEAAYSAAAAVTFRDAMERCIAALEPGWRNRKHAKQWRATLDAYALPSIGDLPVASIGDGDVTRILDALWTAKPETASQVRGRIERILDYARARGWRAGENPARWRGHLEHLAAAIGSLDVATDRVRKRCLGDVVCEIGPLGRPIAESRSEAVYGDIAAAHAPQQHQHRHPAQRSPRPRAGEHVTLAGRVIDRAELCHDAQDDDGSRAQRHAMRLAALHALARHHPDFAGEVYLRPASADRLARPSGREDRELERARRGGGFLPQRRHEVAHHRIGRRGVMLDARHFEAAGQQVLEKRRRLAVAWETFCSTRSGGGQDETVASLRRRS